MDKKRKRRLCSRFLRNIREGRFRRADRPLKLRRVNPCLNVPSRCKLEYRGEQCAAVRGPRRKPAKRLRWGK